jgi:hypothetical protein
MPTLTASTSIFQLAVGVNAILPALISDFEAVRDQVAELFMRQIREHEPDFDIKECDRQEFISFAFMSSRGLRHAKAITNATIAFSVLACGASLAALIWAAIVPEQQISVRQLFAFVGLTLIFGPLLYVARNRFLRWLYSIFVKHSHNEKAGAMLFAHCVKAHIEFTKNWEKIDPEMDMLMASIPLMIWKMRFMTLEMKAKMLWHKIRR